MRTLGLRRVTAAAVAALILSVVGCGHRGTTTPSSRPSEPSAAQPQPGQKALDFSLTTLEGETVRLSDFKGKPLVLSFWASRSPRCVSIGSQAVRGRHSSIPWCERVAGQLDALYQEHKAQGLQVLGVGVDAEEDVRAKAEEMKLSYPVGVGAETARRYGVTELPHAFLISREGEIVASVRGGQAEECLGPGVEMMLAAEGSEEYRAARDEFDAARATFDANEAYRRGNESLRQAQAIRDGGGELGEEWHRLIGEATESYERAVALKPDLWQALSNSGLALLWQAKATSGAEAERLRRLALEKLVAAHRIEPGSYGAYNAACAHALSGEAEECRQWLATARECDALPSVAHMQSDPDLNSVRDEDWFQEYVHP